MKKYILAVVTYQYFKSIVIYIEHIIIKNPTTNRKKPMPVINITKIHFNFIFLINIAINYIKTNTNQVMLNSKCT